MTASCQERLHVKVAAYRLFLSHILKLVSQLMHAWDPSHGVHDVSFSAWPFHRLGLLVGASIRQTLASDWSIECCVSKLDNSPRLRPRGSGRCSSHMSRPTRLFFLFLRFPIAMGLHVFNLWHASSDVIHQSPLPVRELAGLGTKSLAESTLPPSSIRIVCSALLSPSFIHVAPSCALWYPCRRHVGCC